MNALLLAAASAGAIAVFLTTDPGQAALAQTTTQTARNEVQKVETAKPTKAEMAVDFREAPVQARKPKAKIQLPRKAAQPEVKGSMTRTTFVDPDTGEQTQVDIIAFNDG